MAAWDLVIKPKNKGGLGVINLTLQNEALQLKQLDKFYCKVDVQWVNLIWKTYYSTEVPHMAKEKGSFWWKDLLRLNFQMRGVAFCVPSRGDTISFWHDLIDDKIHSVAFPNLFAYARNQRIYLWELKIKGNEEFLDCLGFRV